MEQLVNPGRHAGIRSGDELRNNIKEFLRTGHRLGLRHLRGANLPLRQLCPVGSSRGPKWPTKEDNLRNEKAPVNWGFNFVKLIEIG
jgi:hypothetical protein